MTAVTTSEQVAEAVQHVKSGATTFCTNFFPAQPRLKAWIDRGELAIECHPGCAFFLRRDRDFQHLYFSASDPASLEPALARFSELASIGITADLVGPERSLEALLRTFTNAGFRPYSRLLRLSRSAGVADPLTVPGQAPITPGKMSDASAILALIESAFDRYADQLPALYEIEHAISERQIFVVKNSGEIAGLLFFETQGLTSTLRYWVVADAFRAHGFGSILMRHYWHSQSNARRFILWVRAANDGAVSKYRHYSYAPDGLVDHVMVNSNIDEKGAIHRAGHLNTGAARRKL
jgi:ribosomal protein S18 acetylase RimI-like enzyme